MNNNVHDHVTDFEVCGFPKSKIFPQNTKTKDALFTFQIKGFINYTLTHFLPMSCLASVC